MKKYLGHSWKTTLIGYGLAVLLAVQPLLDVDVDLNNKWDAIKYGIRLVFAAGIAAFGKYAADSRQVKEVDMKVDSHIEDGVPTIGRNDISRGA